ncbi:hypothetical protein [Herbidospora cretacea]|uniref:hypothetical protein n=1 Tax=Herbidospora cretacea TaxID=28444 RepID=UPI0007740CCC|nr:hypothetical protein [Herbidospora cretacea]
MGVTDELWRSVNAGWMLLWAVTFVWLAALAVHLAGVHRRDRRGRSLPDLDLLLCVYLDVPRVLAVRRGRRRREPRNRTFAVNVGVAGLTAGLSAEETVARENVQEEEPPAQEDDAPSRAEAVAALGAVMARLEKRRVLFRVDLREGTVAPGAAVAEAFGRTSRLSGLGDHYVWVTGDFASTGDAGPRLTFEAPYGGDARVAISFVPLEPHAPPSHVRACLGKVQAWNARTRTLTVDPVAVFR